MKGSSEKLVQPSAGVSGDVIIEVVVRRPEMLECGDSHEHDPTRLEQRGRMCDRGASILYVLEDVEE